MVDLGGAQDGRERVGEDRHLQSSVPLQPLRYDPSAALGYILFDSCPSSGEGHERIYNSRRRGDVNMTGRF